MLGIAVAAGLFPVFAFVLAETGDVDQETVHLAALAARPVLDQRALAAQLLARAGLQFWGMADPEVEIALFLLGQAPRLPIRNRPWIGCCAGSCLRGL